MCHEETRQLNFFAASEMKKKSFIRLSLGEVTEEKDGRD
jgi:hypothetical protein